MSIKGDENGFLVVPTPHEKYKVFVYQNSFEKLTGIFDQSL